MFAKLTKYSIANIGMTVCIRAAQGRYMFTIHKPTAEEGFDCLITIQVKIELFNLKM